MRKLMRSRKHRMVAGICGGVADYFGIDPTIVRVIFALILIFGVFVPPILLYVVLYFIIPEEDAWE